MKPVTKYCIRILLGNVALLLILLLPSFIQKNMDTAFTSFILFAIGLFLQLIVGVGLAMNKESREVGRAMLISVGIIFLVGFSICTALVAGI